MLVDWGQQVLKVEVLYESWWIELFAVAEAEQQSQSLDVGKMPSKQEDSESLLCCLNLYNMFSVCMCFCSCRFCYSNNKRIFGHGLQFHATVRLYYACVIHYSVYTNNDRVAVQQIHSYIIHAYYGNCTASIPAPT